MPRGLVGGTTTSPAYLAPHLEEEFRAILAKYGTVHKTLQFPDRREHKIFTPSTNEIDLCFEELLFFEDIFALSTYWYSHHVSKIAISRVVLRAMSVHCREELRCNTICEIFSWNGVEILDDYLIAMVIFERFDMMKRALSPSQLKTCREMATQRNLTTLATKISNLIDETMMKELPWPTLSSMLSTTSHSTYFDFVPVVNKEGRTISRTTFPKDIVHLIDGYLTHPDDAYTIELEVCGTLVRHVLGEEISRCNLPVVRQRTLLRFVERFGASLKANDLVAHLYTLSSREPTLWDHIRAFASQSICGKYVEPELINDFFSHHLTPTEYRNLIQRHIDGEGDAEADDEDE